MVIYYIKYNFRVLFTPSGVKSTQKLWSSKSFVSDEKTTWSNEQSTDQKKYLSKSKKWSFWKYSSTNISESIQAK